MKHCPQHNVEYTCAFDYQAKWWEIGHWGNPDDLWFDYCPLDTFHISQSQDFIKKWVELGGNLAEVQDIVIGVLLGKIDSLEDEQKETT